jgi:hypothetical protein
MFTFYTGHDYSALFFSMYIRFLPRTSLSLVIDGTEVFKQFFQKRRIHRPGFRESRKAVEEVAMPA